MKVLKRLLALLVGLLSIVVFGLCVAGIVEVWLLRKPVTERTTEAFTHADRILDLTVRSTADVKTGLENAQTNLQAIKEVPAATSASSNDTGFFGRMMARALAQELGPRMGQVRQTVDLVTDTSIVLNSLLEGLDKLPLSSVGSIDVDQLRQLQESLPGITESARGLNALLDEFSGGAGPPVDLAKQTTQMEEALQRVLALVSDFQVRLTRIQEEATRLREQTLRWIGLGAVIVTVVLAWVALSQVSLFCHAVSWYRR